MIVGHERSGKAGIEDRAEYTPEFEGVALGPSSWAIARVPLRPPRHPVVTSRAA
jgi:hypothetical protein